MTLATAVIPAETNNVSEREVAPAAIDAVSSAALERKSEPSRGNAGLAAAPKFQRAVVPLDSIAVGETFGRELDDAHVGMLAGIVERYGMRDPITVTPDLRLLAGHRWLTAVKKLGWPTVEVVIVEASP
jgi:hypothetical protein